MSADHPTNFAAECMACQIDRQLRAMPDDWPEPLRTEYMRAVLGLVLETEPWHPGPLLVRRLNALARQYGVPQPDYAPVKRRFNALMLSLAPRLREEIDSAADPLCRAIQLSRAANYIDFGTMAVVSETALFDLLAKAQDEDLGPEYPRFREEVQIARRLVLLTDNCGEIVADRLLLEELRKINPALSIIAMVRGAPVLNDATLEDARETGLDAVAEVMGNGSDICGTWRPELSPAALECLERADLILAKGQANFETLNGSGLNVYYLFLCKCTRFQRRFHMAPLRGVMANDRRLTAWEDGQA